MVLVVQKQRKLKAMTTLERKTGQTAMLFPETMGNFEDGKWIGKE